MSVAFTKEQDAESAAADLPDRPISPHPNLVTPEGLAALDAGLASARAAWASARAGEDVNTDRTPMARATRDLRYYSVRRANARLITPEAGADVVRFGGGFTLEREDGRRQTFRIVGEDEADPAGGSVSHVSPLAQAVLGKGVGDITQLAGQKIEIVAVA